MRRRLVWLGAAAAALALFLFDNSPVTAAAALAAWLLPALSGAALFLPGAAPRAALRLPDRLSRGEAGRGAVVLENPARRPLALLRCRVEVENLRTGETARLTLERALGPGGRGEAAFTLTAAHYGAVRVRGGGLELWDVFGLFCRRFPWTEEGRVRVAPPRRRMEVSLGESGECLGDGETYSPLAPGSDPSETFRVREYVPGDPVSRIHWKLSEKTEKTLVRDLGLPVARELLLLAETAALPGEDVSPEDWDFLLELTLSLSQNLLEGERPHVLGLRDGTGAYREVELGSGEALAEAEALLLAAPVLSGGETAISGYLAQEPRRTYAHLAVTAPRTPPDWRALAGGKGLTLLVPAEAAEPPGVGVSREELEAGRVRLEL